MSISSDYQFKAHSDADAAQWHSTIASFSNSGGSLPTSPVESRNITPIATRMDEPQTQGVTSTGPTPTSATAKSPASNVPMNAASPTATGAGSHFASRASPPAGDVKYVEK